MSGFWWDERRADVSAGFLCSVKSPLFESKQKNYLKESLAVECLFTSSTAGMHLLWYMIVIFQSAHCLKSNQWLISPCTRGMTVWRLSVCFSSPSLFTGNFHVVNGAIDWSAIVFVLGSVHHLRRKHERELVQVLIHGVVGTWSMFGHQCAGVSGMISTPFQKLSFPVLFLHLFAWPWCSLMHFHCNTVL